MAREEELLKEYEKKLIYAWSKANTKSKKRRLLYDLNTFSVISSLYPSIAKEYDWENDMTYLELFENTTIPFLDNIMESRDIFSPCFSNIIEIFKKVDFPFYKDYRKQYRYLLEKESQEIMLSFLSEYNEDMLSKYKKLIEEDKLFTNNPLRSSALYCSIDSLEESFIYPVTDLKESIYKSSLLAHELGHLYETEIFYQVKNKSFRKESDILPFYEVASRSFEYAYLRYLLDNNIHTEDVKLSLRRYYLDLLVHSYDINIIYKLKNIKLNENGYIVVEDPKVIDYGNKIMDYLNYGLLYIENGDMFDFKESFIYGIGNIFSIYLYKNYKEDPNNYRKEFRNAILNYPYSKGIEAFERVGITKEELLNGSEVTKVLIKAK